MAISELYCCYILMVVSGFARAMSTTMNKNKNGPSAAIVLHWFRHGDLRLHDNPALVFSSKAEYVLPIFCFDNSVYGSSCATPSGSLKCGPRRAKFVLESVEDLRQNIQDRWGGELLVTHGKPADVFDQVLCEFKGRAVDIVVQDEVLKEERDVVNSVRSVLKKHCKNGILHAVWGSTMYDIDDLPFEKDLQDMPDVFTPFKNKVEKSCHIRRPLPTPNKLAVPSKEIQKLVGLLGKSPTLESLGYSEEDIKESETPDARGVMAFVGGEAAALKRVNEYIWEKDLLKDYFETRNGMIGADYSTKLSPWLAHGCVSPRFVAAECKKYEEQRVANKSTYWVVFELLWRDFCKFFALKNGDAVFFAGGTIGSNKKWPHFAKNFQAWKEGRTGYPLVDANMRELKATGFMSNRGRQNVASFLALDCNNDWRAGGDWFETHLLDYDVYSNWVVSSCVFIAWHPEISMFNYRTGVLQQE